MTLHDMTPQDSGDGPDEIEALLPWHAAGTLNASDAARVNAALALDPALARQFAAVQDEYAETIHLNESLGVPSARAKQKLFAAIDAEPARKPIRSVGLAARFAEFFGSLSPRTLAASAMIGALALLLQAGVIGSLLTTGKSGGYETASYVGASGTGSPVALVRFAPAASVADVSAFLASYGASIIDGPKAGMFRLRVGEKPLSKTELDAVIGRMQADRTIAFVASAR